MSEEETVVLLDAQGLLCPLPVLRARKAMMEVPHGGVLRVLATDPGAAKDFNHYCAVTGHKMVSCNEQNGVFTFSIKKMA